MNKVLYYYFKKIIITIIIIIIIIIIHFYISRRDKGALRVAVYQEQIPNDTGKDKEALNEENMQRFLAKALHDQFFRNTTERDKKSWEWLKKEKLKKKRRRGYYCCSGPGTENEKH